MEIYYGNLGWTVFPPARPTIRIFQDIFFFLASSRHHTKIVALPSCLTAGVASTDRINISSSSKVSRQINALKRAFSILFFSLLLLVSALLSGTLRTYQRAGCDRELVTLGCPRGTSISIEVAQYGRTGGTYS